MDYGELHVFSYSVAKLLSGCIMAALSLPLQHVSKSQRETLPTLDDLVHKHY